MASTSKAFKKCVDPCPRYLTPDNTHNCCVFCLGEEHARDVLEGAICMHCELFSMRIKSWGSQVDLADELEREHSLSRESAENEGEPLDYDDAISLTSSDPAASALLGYAQEEQEMSEGEEVEIELSQTCPAYKELLEGMRHAPAVWNAPR